MIEIFDAEAIDEKLKEQLMPLTNTQQSVLASWLTHKVKGKIITYKDDNFKIIGWCYCNENAIMNEVFLGVYVDITYRGLGVGAKLVDKAVEIYHKTSKFRFVPHNDIAKKLYSRIPIEYRIENLRVL